MNYKVTLINLGGPRNEKEIEVFLKDLFLDPYVFDLPLWEPLRRILAKFIASKRAPKVATTYASMQYGGGSPLVDETIKQAEALALVLSEATGDKWEGNIAMACGFPNLRDLLTSLSDFPSKNNVWVPLFPQFSRSTVLSLGKFFESKLGTCPLGCEGWVDTFSLDKRFIQLTANFIVDFFQGNLENKNYIHLDNYGQTTDWQELDLVFSAHGVPMRLIHKGDKYVSQMEECILQIEKELRIKGFKGKIHLSYQSRVGPGKWTEPNTKTTLEKLGNEKRNIAVYPISFISDHLETLEEIGVELKDLALNYGALSYHRIPAFGTYPPFINFLKDLVLESMNKNKTECLCFKLGGESPGRSCQKFL